MAASTSFANGASPTRARQFWKRLRAGEEISYLVTLAAASTIVLIVVALVYQLWTTSTLPVQKFGWSFLKGMNWDPNSGDFGALPFIYGTCVTSFLALLIAVPTGIGASIFLAELAPPKLSNAMTFLIELLAAVP